VLTRLGRWRTPDAAFSYEASRLPDRVPTHRDIQVRGVDLHVLAGHLALSPLRANRHPRDVRPRFDRLIREVRRTVGAPCPDVSMQTLRSVQRYS
jgi:hypothetical protein